MLFSCYALSKGNPIEDARSLFRQLREVIGDGEILGLGITGYGKDLLKGHPGRGIAGVVETIAHASAGLHYFPDAGLHLRCASAAWTFQDHGSSRTARVVS